MSGLFAFRRPVAIGTSAFSPALGLEKPAGGIPMTYDPYRQPSPQDPYENPYRVHEADSQTGTGAALLLGALLLAAIGGFVYYSTGDQPSVANNEMRPPITQSNEPANRSAPETTGAGQSNIEPGDRPAGAPQQ
jgi:hypothetical protein